MTLGVITHLKPDYLECKLKWVLRSITMNKVSGGDGISAELFQILKYAATKVLYSVYQQIWETQQEKVSFHFNHKEGQCQKMFKLSHTCIHSYARKDFIMLKSFKVPLNNMRIENFQMFKLDL